MIFFIVNKEEKKNLERQFQSGMIAINPKNEDH